MSGGFRSVPFSAMNLEDPFFDSLKEDYPANPKFADWFQRKANAGECALAAFSDDGYMVALLYLKPESGEPVDLVEGRLPPMPRLKIGTLKISESSRGDRLGEGAVGMALWQWRNSGLDEIYVTVFEKHHSLVGLLEKFGFKRAGLKSNGESVYLRSRTTMDYSTAYRAFPFVNPSFEEASILTVDQGYHDQLFPYSELAGTEQEVVSVAAGNGVTKVYVGHGWQMTAAPNNPVLIYRRSTGQSPGFKSVVTSYGVVTDVRQFKQEGRVLRPFEEYRELVKNKSVFDDEELEAHWNETNVVVVELVYLGYFGPGRNINWVWLKNNGLTEKSHPNQWRYTRDEFFKIMQKGGVPVEDVVVH